jgi:hypothetical protein
VVARHKEIPQDVVEFSERISQFSRAAGFPVDRVVYAYRVFRAPSGNWHIMSRISDAGASFTGRTNHLAEHLVVDEGEVQKLIAAGGTPAGTILAYSWPSFSGDSRWLSSTEAWEAKALRANPYGDKWAELCPDGNAKRRRLLSCDPGVTPPTFFEYPDRLRTSAGAKEILHLFAESESDCPKRGWVCAFTTDLQPSDNQADFQWIGLPSSSPLVASLKASGRRLVDLRSPVPETSATKRSASTGKTSQTPSTGHQRPSPSRAARKRVARSSWPMWLKISLGCLGVLLLIAVPSLFFVLSKLNGPAPSSSVEALEDQRPEVASSASKTHNAALPEVTSTPKPTPPPRKFEKTFLVRYEPTQRPGMLGSYEKQESDTVKAADSEVQELFNFIKNNNKDETSNSSAFALSVQYLAWQRRGDSPDQDDMGEVNSHREYGKYFVNRGTDGKAPDEPLDLSFEFSQRWPLRIIELEEEKTKKTDMLPMREAQIVIEAEGVKESVNVLDIKDNPDLIGLRSRTDEAITLRPDKALIQKLVGVDSPQDGARDLALLIVPDEEASPPTLEVKNLQWISEKRKALQDRADGKFLTRESELKGVMAFLESWHSADNNSRSLLNALLEHFGEQPIPDREKSSSAKAERDAAVSDSSDKNLQSSGNQPEDPNPIFLAAESKLSNSRKPGAEQTRKILSGSKTLDASKLKQSLLDEMKRLLREDDENQQTRLKEIQRQAQETLKELFGNGSSLLPAGDYILGLTSEESFYPAMKVRISFGRNVEAQKGRAEGDKSLTRPGSDPANPMNSAP